MGKSRPALGTVPVMAAERARAARRAAGHPHPVEAPRSQSRRRRNVKRDDPGRSSTREAITGLWFLTAVACTVPTFACGRSDGPVLFEVERRQVAHSGVVHETHVSDPALAVLGDAPILAFLGGRDGRFHVFVHPPDANEPARVDPEDVVPAPAHQPPGLAVGPDGDVYVSWAARRPAAPGDPFASDLRLSRSTDGGHRFDAPLRVHDDTPGSRNFEGVAVVADGAVLVAWIDSRDGPASYAARILDGARVESETRVDGDTCPCCRIAVAPGPGHEVALAIRKVFPGSVRDFVLARSADGGRLFAAPLRVAEDGWAIDACPHRGGALAVDGTGGTLLAWYTEGRDQRPQLRLARAEAGAPFGAPISLHVDPKTVPDRVALALAPDGRGVVVWEAFTPARRVILARATSDGGRRFGPPRVLSTAVKAMGPAAAVGGDGSLWVAWNEERFPSLHTVLLRLAVDPRVQRTGTSK